MSLREEVKELKEIMHGMLQKMKAQQAQIDNIAALMCAPDVLKSTGDDDNDGLPLLGRKRKPMLSRGRAFREGK